MLTAIIFGAIYKEYVGKNLNEKHEISGSFSNILRPIKFLLETLK
jgi:hypothetical protein